MIILLNILTFFLIGILGSSCFPVPLVWVGIPFKVTETLWLISREQVLVLGRINVSYNTSETNYFFLQLWAFYRWKIIQWLLELLKEKECQTLTDFKRPRSYSYFLSWSPGNPLGSPQLQGKGVLINGIYSTKTIQLITAIN